MRAPIAQRVSCAYRVLIDHAHGSFFGETTGYEGYIERCYELAAQNPFVLVTDITDFYNQIYLHRLQNVIALAAPDLGDFANAIEDYLIALNASVSKGIPVGPAASIVMAEAVLNDLDQVIQQAGLVHTRYVDDIRVFGFSREPLDNLLQEITKYLYETHRLTVASSKTTIIPSEDFVAQYLQSPDIVELRSAHERLNTLKSRGDAYSSSQESVPSALGSAPDPNVMQTLIANLCARPILDLGLARHILKKARQYRIRAIVPQLLENFDFFAPVMPAVVLYLHKVSSGGFVDRNVDVVAKLYDHESARKPFVRMWLDNYTAQYLGYMKHPRIRSEVMNSSNMAAKASGAQTLKDVAWVRRHKPEVDSMGAFDRRQVMRASLVLAQDERASWLRHILRNQNSIVDRAVVRWLLAQ